MKVAIVTGGSSGIGQSAAIKIARRSQERAQETVGIIEKEGGRAVALPLDLGRTETFPDFRRSVIAALHETWQRDDFDVLVNNAGLAEAAAFEDTTEEMFDRLEQSLLKGPYFLTQTLLPFLADGGAIINTSSNSALPHVTEPGYSAYATMKGGLMVLTRYLAKELSPRGIRVNAIAPGSTVTRLTDNAFERFPEVIPALAAKTALGRVGEPDDVGAVIATLLSDACRWITAQIIEVSGGYNL